MEDFLFGLASSAAAFLAAIGVVLALATMAHWGRSRNEGLLPYIFYPLMALLMLAALLSGRNLYLPMEHLDSGGEKHALLAWASRASSLFVALAATERILKHLLHFGSSQPCAGVLIWLFGFYFLTNIVTSAVLATHPSISHEYFYTALIGCAALLLTRSEGDSAIRAMRNALLVFLIASAACIAWRPELVLGHYTQGIVPGLGVRYAGLSNHANSTGALIVAFLLCLWDKPYASRWLNHLAWWLGLISLLLTQSKTSWIAFVLCTSCVAYWRYGPIVRQALADTQRPALPQFLLVLAMLASGAIATIIMFSSERIDKFFATRAGADLLSLSGRSRIWEVALQEWRDNPLFGYGLTIWNDTHRAQIGLPDAFSAHNQFFQSLASAGVVGVAGLTLYAIALFHFSLKSSRPSRGLTLALFLLIFIRAISESPLDLTGLGSEQLIHFLLLMLLAANAPAGDVAGKARRQTLPPYALSS